MFSVVPYMFSDVLRCFWCSQDALICSQMCSRCVQMISDVRICFQKITNVGCWIFSRSSLGVLLMFLGCSQDFPRIFSGCSDGSCERGGSGGSGLVFWV